MNGLLKVLANMLPNQSKRLKKFNKGIEQTLSEKKQDEQLPPVKTVLIALLACPVACILILFLIMN